MSNMEMKADQQALMQDIMAADFMAYELQLFLDTHPEDKRALALFSEVSQRAEKLKKEYEERFCPLRPRGAAGRDTWHWTDSPWPWQK